MTWTDLYQAPTLSEWRGRADTPPHACFFQIIEAIDLRENLFQRNEDELTFGLLGFCCDAGIQRNLGRVGARNGPNAIRLELARLPMQKTNVHCFDVGNIICNNDNLEEAQGALASVVKLLLAHHITPIVLGGGHEIAYGHYQGIVSEFPELQLGIVNFDAHFDMRPLLNGKGTSGTPFLQIAHAAKEAHKKFDYNVIGIQAASNIHQLFETAKAWNTHVIMAEDLHQGYVDKCVNFVDRIIDENDIIYTSICLDVFASAYAPGVSAPQIFGLTPWQVVPLLRQLAASGKVVSYDIAELSPALDVDQRTAKLAANFIYEIIHHHSLGKKHGHNFSQHFTS